MRQKNHVHLSGWIIRTTRYLSIGYNSKRTTDESGSSRVAFDVLDFYEKVPKEALIKIGQAARIYYPQYYCRSRSCD
jgi:hypothetical protein